MYTKEQRLEMLNEMWKECNEEFCKAMSEERYQDASQILLVWDAVKNLHKLLED